MDLKSKAWPGEISCKHTFFVLTGGVLKCVGGGRDCQLLLQNLAERQGAPALQKNVGTKCIESAHTTSYEGTLFELDTKECRLKTTKSIS